MSSMPCFIERASARVAGECGQATVEAAFALPVVFALFGLLLQPAVLLYDRCVMQSAAAETCRLAATQTCSDAAVRAFVLRRLAVIPQIDLFHSRDCECKVEVAGAQTKAATTVSVKCHVKTLPLLGITASTMTEPAGDGCALLTCQVQSTVFPSWLGQVEGSPAEWVSQWG